MFRLVEALLIQMQVRFDGNIGFIGGLVDTGENAIEGLNRECCEEINLDISQFRLLHFSYTSLVFLC